MSKDEFTDILRKTKGSIKKNETDSTSCENDKIVHFGKVKSRDHKWLYPAETFDVESKFELFDGIPKTNSKYGRHRMHVNMKKDLGRSVETRKTHPKFNLTDKEYNPRKEVVMPRAVKDVVNFRNQTGRDTNPYF